MTPARRICGHPVKFYRLDRPRDDVAPVCYRPPHTGKRHMSPASWEHSVRYQQERTRRDRERKDHT
jgi:hypothetical protein